MEAHLSEEIQHWLDGLGMFGWKLGLERMHALLKALGGPHRAYPVVHIAGSNGKGSVARMLEAAYTAAGLRVGLYTSPHLVSPVERIRIGGREVEAARFEAALRELRPLLERHEATYFETMTVLGFHLFAQERVQLAVVETGLGGRLDATNVVQPAAAVITSISMEHRQILGPTLAAIAREKAGIVKPGVPCVVGRLPKSAESALLTICRERRAPVVHAGESVRVRVMKMTADGMHLRFSLGGEERLQVYTPLVGRHQAHNAALALATLQLPEAAFGATPEHFATAMAQLRIPGRFQRIPGPPEVILDVAHNPAGMRALVDTLRETHPGMAPVVLFGMLRDRDPRRMLQYWRKMNPEFVFVTPKSDRALAAAAVAEVAEELGLRGRVADNAAAAWSLARQAAHGRPVVVTGSHYTVGELLPLIEP